LVRGSNLTLALIARQYIKNWFDFELKGYKYKGFDFEFEVKKEEKKVLYCNHTHPPPARIIVSKC